MPQRKVPLVPGEFYHIYNRGNSKQNIFFNDADYQRFTSLLYLANGDRHIDYRELDKAKIFEQQRGESKVAIGCYCLMPNHFHILLTPLVENGVQDFMLKVATGYSMYLNRKRNRTGSLFEGRFKSEHADEDRYLKYLFSYIHLNPVALIQNNWRKEGIKIVSDAFHYLKNYQYSSYYDIYNERQASAVLNHKPFPKYFTNSREIKEELLEWLTYNDH